MSGKWWCVVTNQGFRPIYRVLQATALMLCLITAGTLTLNYKVQLIYHFSLMTQAPQNMGPALMVWFSDWTMDKDDCVLEINSKNTIFLEYG